MKIMKFGGTSIGSVSRIKEVVKLINNGEQNIVVLSAMSGTTNDLVEIINYLRANDIFEATKYINKLENKYKDVIKQLYTRDESFVLARNIIYDCFKCLRSYLVKSFSNIDERIILSQGELLSTNIVYLYLQECNISSVLISALDFMLIDENGEPNMEHISDKLIRILKLNPNKKIYLTQGYICCNHCGEIDNLQRGGSDYTASLLGAAIKAEEIQIWTDIDGMHNNDPRFVENTKPIPYLHFDEAAELAYFGAKILHPTCILPAKINNIPVRLLNTLEPKAAGTLISNKFVGGVIEAIAAKDNIAAIKIKSGRMLLAYGFLRKVFEIFEKYQTPIDMITTSEVGVSVTIDNTEYISEILDELQEFGAVSIDEDMVIVCVVGDLSYKLVGFQSKVINALKDIPIRMISYGGSNFNISMLIDSKYKKEALQCLSNSIF